MGENEDDDEKRGMIRKKRVNMEEEEEKTLPKIKKGERYEIKSKEDGSKARTMVYGRGLCGRMHGVLPGG